MAIISSNSVVFSLGGETAVCPKTTTLQFDLELKDLQCSASNGYKRSSAGNVSWQGTSTFVADTGAGLSMADIFNGVKNRALVAVSIAVTGGSTFTGNVWVTNATLNAPENADPVELSITFTGDDAPTIA